MVGQQEYDMAESSSTLSLQHGHMACAVCWMQFSTVY